MNVGALTDVKEYGNFLLVESGMLVFGIRNIAQGIVNRTNDFNQEFKFHYQRVRTLVPRIRNPPHVLDFQDSCKGILDSLIWGDV